jgi:thioredoxin reductase
MKQGVAIIIGAGPPGLTAAIELQRRTGMHKYNNQDHSMLTAMTAVENIVSGVTTKDNIWAINTETEYHEQKAE